MQLQCKMIGQWVEDFCSICKNQETNNNNNNKALLFWGSLGLASHPECTTALCWVSLKLDSSPPTLAKKDGWMDGRKNVVFCFFICC